MKTVIIIIGPTASGKTKLSIELAKEVGGEIISADSMQVYRYMDIGTAKPTREEMDGIKHYMVDEVNPDEEFSVASFQESAYRYIEEIHKKNKVPIIAGGTGLYINSLVYNINFTETTSDWKLREELKKEAEEKGKEYLHKKLESIDPEAAGKLHVNDVKRVIRAIEVFEYTKKPISYHQEVSRLNPPKYRYLLIGLKMDRERLYLRINDRVDRMLEEGLVDEVKRLTALGYDKSTVSMQGLGYKEILSYLRGEITLEEAVYLIKRDTRHYAKRQITWFKRLQDVLWIDMDKETNTESALKIIKDYIASAGIFL